MGNDLKVEEIDYVVKRWRHIPVYLDHRHDDGPIGWVSHFEKGDRGELVAHMMISTKTDVGQKAYQGMMNDLYRELSLGQFSHLKNGQVVRISPAEVSICEKGARDGSRIEWFTDKTQKQVLSQIYKRELEKRDCAERILKAIFQNENNNKQPTNRHQQLGNSRLHKNMNPEIETLRAELMKQQQLMQQLLNQQQQQQQQQLLNQQQQQQQQQQQPNVVQAPAVSAPVAAVDPAAAAAAAAMPATAPSPPAQETVPLDGMPPDMFLQRYKDIIQKLGRYAPNGDPEEFIKMLDHEVNRQQEQKMEEFRKQVELIRDAGGFGPDVGSTDDIVRMVQDVPPQVVGVFASVASNYREKEKQYQATQQELESMKSKVTNLQQKADVLENTLKRTQQVGLASHQERFPTSAQQNQFANAATNVLNAAQVMKSTPVLSQSPIVPTPNLAGGSLFASTPSASPGIVLVPPRESIFDKGLIDNRDIAKAAARSITAANANQNAKTTYADPMFVGDKVEQFRPM